VRTSEWSAAFRLALTSIAQITSFLIFLYCYYSYEKIRTYVNGAQIHAKSTKDVQTKIHSPGARFITNKYLRLQRLADLGVPCSLSARSPLRLWRISKQTSQLEHKM
jgi:hypothetical protein